MNFQIETLNRWGEHFLNFAWPMLWQSSALIAVVFVLDLALRRKVRAAVRHALWLVVLVKLLLPPTLALPTGPSWWIHSPAPPPVKAAPVSFTVSYGEQTMPDFPPAPAPIIPPKPPALTLAAWAMILSSVVSASLFVWLLVRWRGIARTIQNASAAGELNDLLAETARLAGIRSPVRLKLAGDSMSPAVCGLLRPVILLPQSLVGKLSAEQLRAVLLHETIHLRRGDVWMNCAQALLQIVYWWHPLLWLANARIRRAREEAVDDAVMLALRDDADIYAPTLLEVAKFAFRRPLASLGLVGILESRSALRQRIERLMDFNAPRKAGLTVVSILGILAFSAVALPMGEAPEKTNAPTASAFNLTNSATASDINTNAVTGILSNADFRAAIRALEQRTQVETLAEPKAVVTSGRQTQLRNVNVVESADYTPAAQSDASSTMTFKINQPMNVGRLEKSLLDGGVKIPPTTYFYANDSSILLVRGTKEQLALIYRAVLKLNGVSPKEAESIVNDFAKQGSAMTNVNPAATNLEMRVFKLDPRTFLASLRVIPGLQTNNIATMVESLFSKLGVDLAATGRSIVFNDRLGQMFVKATPSELDTIERIIQALNQTPPQIHIKARFIEVEQENDARRGFDWYLGSFTNGPVVANGGSTLLLAVPVSATNRPGSFPSNTTTSVIPASATDQQLTSGLRNTAPAPGTATGILTDPNFRVTLHALESRPRTTILAEPECVTTSGRRTEMRATDIMTVLTNINPLALKPPGVSNNELFLTKQVECGPVFDVVPYVLADGYTINLTAIASVTEFLGYDKPTNSVTAYINGKKQTVLVPLPKFRTQKMSTVVNLWDNQTLVLGGSVASAVQTIKHKVPLIADLPLVGWMFQSQTENSVEKKLMVFVTATIVDPVGNRVHSDDGLRQMQEKTKSYAPPQPKISSPSP